MDQDEIEEMNREINAKYEHEQQRKDRRRRIFEQLYIAEFARHDNPELDWLKGCAEMLLRESDKFAEMEFIKKEIEK